MLAEPEGGVPSGEIGSDSVENLDRDMGRLELEDLVWEAGRAVAGIDL